MRGYQHGKWRCLKTTHVGKCAAEHGGKWMRYNKVTRPIFLALWGKHISYSLVHVHSNLWFKIKSYSVPATMYEKWLESQHKTMKLVLECVL